MPDQDEMDQDPSDDDLMGVSELLHAALADSELVGIPQVHTLPELLVQYLHATHTACCTVRRTKRRWRNAEVLSPL